MASEFDVGLRHSVVVISAALLPVFALPNARAADAQPGSPAAPVVAGPGTPLQEVVVTATRRSEPLSKVPASVAVLTKNALVAEDVQSINDVARLTPGLSVQPIGSSDVLGAGQVISIQGIASTVGSPTTGVYIDDVPIEIRSLGNETEDVFPEIFDLQRIEVLRGPQGTLFGAGAEGGVVRFITTPPSLTSYSTYDMAQISTTQGGGPSFEAGGAVGGPIVPDRLGFRVSAWEQQQGGYISQVNPTTLTPVQSNANTAENRSFDGSLAWRLTSSLTARLSLYNQVQVNNGSPVYYEDLSDPDNGVFRAGNLIPDKVTNNFTLPALRIEYSGSGYDVISETSYFNDEVSRNIDYSDFIGAVMFNDPYADGPGQYDQSSVEDGVHSFTQEIRAQSSGTGKFNWVVGLFYDHDRQTTYQDNYDPYFNEVSARLGAPTIPLLDGTDLFVTQGSSLDEQEAAYGQASYEILKGLSLIAGARIARTEFSAARASEGPVAGGVPPYVASQSQTPVTPKYGISWQVDPGHLLYANVAKGFRVGGINGPQISLCQPELQALGMTLSSSSYKSDSVWEYEVGSKNSLLGGALAIDASAFDIEWSNIQREIALTGCGSSFIDNFGNARSMGFDFSVNARPIGGLLLSANAGYADARLTQNVLTTSSGVTTVFGRSGDKIGGPPWSATLMSEYDLPISASDIGYGRVDYQHVSGGPTPDYAIFGADPEVGASDSYNYVGLRTGVRKGSLDISLFVQNLLNTHPVLSRMRFTTTAADQLFLDSTLVPRTYGVTVVYDWKE